jgi:hypothetical protein
MCEMASVENSQTEASHHAAAIDRWENEGGASNLSSSMTNTKLSKEHQRPLRITKKKQKENARVSKGQGAISLNTACVPTEEHP